MLTREEVLAKYALDDACFPCTWSVDLHYPEKKFQPGFEGEEFVSVSLHDRYEVPFWAPYRCLYSRNITNLFMAGRDISVTDEALGAVRVMRTTGMMGEVIALAVSLCRQHNVSPREVYTKHLQEFRQLLTGGVRKPEGIELDDWTVMS